MKPGLCSTVEMHGLEGALPKGREEGEKKEK